MEARPRRRRWPKVLGVLAVLLVVGAIFVNAQLEPHRLADTVLGRAGESLKLEIRYQGTPEYAFRPEPRLVLPNLSVGARGSKIALLSARRAEISLPWSTITGGEPVITRIELDEPALHLPSLRRWLASRPPQPFRLPTLSRGIAVRQGQVIDSEWGLEGLSLELPHLRTGDSATLSAQGRLLSGKRDIPFKLRAVTATPGLKSPLDLDLQLTLPPQGGKPNLVSVSLLGAYEWADPKFVLDATQLGVVAVSPLPSFEGKGHFESSDSARLDFDAVLNHWPEAWPKLPDALAKQSEKLPLHLHYQGKPDFSDALELSAARDETSLTAALRWPELQRWLAADKAAPLPPLNASLKTPALEFEGVKLEGVEVEISEGGNAGAAP